MEELGAGEILLTSMDRDGTKDGYDIELTRTISQSVDIPVIASGGVGTLEHLYEGLVSGKATPSSPPRSFTTRNFRFTGEILPEGKRSHRTTVNYRSQIPNINIQ